MQKFFNILSLLCFYPLDKKHKTVKLMVMKDYEIVTKDTKSAQEVINAWALEVLKRVLKESPEALDAFLKEENCDKTRKKRISEKMA